MNIAETITSHGWDIADHVASKKWQFKTFAAAHMFVGKVAALAEEQNHHPDISYGWGYVYLSMTTHDVGALSEKDVALVEAIEEMGS